MVLAEHFVYELQTADGNLQTAICKR